VQRIRRPIAALLGSGLVAACVLVGATAQASDHSPPVAQTLAPSDVTTTSALLHGSVYAGRQKTTYWFDVGPTKAYGAHTQPDEVNKNAPVAVQSSVSGLIKGSVYHVRLVAINDDGLSLGADMTFTAAAPVAPPAVAPAPTPAIGAPPAVPPPVGGPTPALAPPAPPVLGQSVGVAAPTGDVLVRLPGADRAVALTSPASVPVGSILDTRKGTLSLSSALPGDGTQTGTFHGGLFEIRQAAGARGMTELVLRGPRPLCGAAGAARGAAASAKRPPRALWGRDDHGRFRTRGSNSVATVRGTAWYVEDRCDGTLTRVSKGSVSVRDLHRQRTVIVHAGDSYLARSGR
jgi:hypothetical protein